MTEYEPGGEPCAVIERVGRWEWRVFVEYTPTRCLPMIYGTEGYGSRVFGRHRAERKARRLLRSFLRREGYEPERIELR